MTVPTDQPLYLVAAGKAAGPMAAAFLEEVPRVAAGVVAGPRLNAGDLPGHVEVIDPAHPSPDRESERAGRIALQLAGLVREGGRLAVLISGGASSMLAAPVEGLTLPEKAAAARALMDAGTPIEALNCVRKHLSAIKGGRLAAAAGFRTLTLALSDVHAPVPDDPAVIGSGPTVPDPTTYADALDVVASAGREMPARVRAHLEAGRSGRVPETPKPEEQGFEASPYCVIGNRHDAMRGAAAAAAAAGYAVRIIERPTRGNARGAGEAFAAEALRAAPAGSRGLCVIGSGETTVIVTGDGVGGRNQEFALGAIARLAGSGCEAAMASIGTDGIDGPTDAAGALIDSTSKARAEAAGVDPARALGRNDSYSFFRALGDLIVLGPTGTNVGDLHVLLLQDFPCNEDASPVPP